MGKGDFSKGWENKQGPHEDIPIAMGSPPWGQGSAGIPVMWMAFAVGLPPRGQGKGALCGQGAI